MLYYQLTGNAQATHCLVFIHGFACGSENWRLQANYFSNDYQILLPDLPGHARSASLATAVDIISLAHSLAELINSLAISKKLIIIGHSMAVRVAVELYAIISSPVDKLVLVDCGYEHLTYHTLNTSYKAITKSAYQAWVKDFFAQTFTLTTAPAIKTHVLDLVAQLDHRLGGELMANIMVYDYYALPKVLQLIKCPTLIIPATVTHNRCRYLLAQTQDFPSDWLELVQKNIQQVQIKTVANSGHFIMLEQPQLINQLLQNFLSN